MYIFKSYNYAEYNYKKVYEEDRFVNKFKTYFFLPEQLEFENKKTSISIIEVYIEDELSAIFILKKKYLFQDKIMRKISPYFFEMNSSPLFFKEFSNEKNWKWYKRRLNSYLIKIYYL